MLYRVICGCLSAAISANYPLQHPHIRRSAFYPRPYRTTVVTGNQRHNKCDFFTIILVYPVIASNKPKYISTVSPVMINYTQ